jgi:hypothetical protein
MAGYNPPSSLQDAIRNALEHLQTPIPQERTAMSADYTNTNILKISLEIFAGSALQHVRASVLYRNLRARMEQEFLILTGVPLPP